MNSIPYFKIVVRTQKLLLELKFTHADTGSLIAVMWETSNLPQKVKQILNILSLVSVAYWFIKHF